ncbi:DUF4402 domain-containing protein [Sphingomonas piscis]|uniref:DUF4402 domain-containing protein n=1 Tax=Sphingomonas piscis TaxID=2714943 RepID=A0A6G7YPP6_9SPHN|nr:DUF4402 domain-containing protein [Sphingomonas piscis]QIK78715.1 DUF4402 domain-containing protein [Sphingomonas piscis]
MPNSFKTAALAVCALIAYPAAAATPQPQATATVNIKKPLTISRVSDLSFGSIVLSGATPFTAVVSISQTGVLTCPATVTCSGTTSRAVYNLRGSNNQVVAVTSPNITLSNGTNTLAMTVSAPATVTLTSSGAPGNDFGIGGSLTLTDTTPDGVYTGTFNVTADYQ